MLTNSIDFGAGATNAPLGSELVTNGDFSSGTTGWTYIGSGSFAAVSGAGRLTLPTPVANRNDRQTYFTLSSLTIGKFYLISVSVTLVSNVTNVTIGFSANVADADTAAPFAQTTTTRTVTFYGAASATTMYLRAMATTYVDGGSFSIDNVSVRELLDSSLAPDKMTLCAGVRKLSDAATGMLMELSVASGSNAGSFQVRSPNGAANNYLFGSVGTVESLTTASGYVAPITNVLTGLGDISGDSAILRINGVQASSSTSDQGTGNYGNYPLYLFSRAGTSLFFNGRFYGGVGRGAQSNDQQNAALTAYLNSKTRAF
jgi:hypothetical protein